MPKLLTHLEDGFDLVSGWKQDRQDPGPRPGRPGSSTGSRRVMTGVRLHDFNSGFKIYRREVVEELRLYGELHRFIPALAAWRGFRVDRGARASPPAAVRPIEVRLGPPLAGFPRSPDGAVPDPLHAAAAPPLRGPRARRMGGGVRGQPYLTGHLAGRRAADRAIARSWPSACSACWSGSSSSPRSAQRADPQLPDAERRRRLDPVPAGLIAGRPAERQRGQVPVARTRSSATWSRRFPAGWRSWSPPRALAASSRSDAARASSWRPVGAPPGTRLDGLELDETALAQARVRCPGATFVRGDAYDAPLREPELRPRGVPRGAGAPGRSGAGAAGDPARLPHRAAC